VVTILSRRIEAVFTEKTEFVNEWISILVVAATVHLRTGDFKFMVGVDVNFSGQQKRIFKIVGCLVLAFVLRVDHFQNSQAGLPVNSTKAAMRVC
jgi:hypothetical protein